MHVVKSWCGLPGYVYKPEQCGAEKYLINCEKKYFDPEVLNFLYNNLTHLRDIPQLKFDVTQKLISFCNLSYTDLWDTLFSNISETIDDKNVGTFTGTTESYYFLSNNSASITSESPFEEGGESLINYGSIYPILSFVILFTAAFLGCLLNKKKLNLKEINRDLEYNFKLSKEEQKINLNCPEGKEYDANKGFLNTITGCCFSQSQEYNKLLGSTGPLNHSTVEEV